MSTTGEQAVWSLMHTGDLGAWSLAALVVALRDGGDDAQKAAALEVLRAHGIDPDALADINGSAAASQASAPLLQAAALVGKGDTSWADQPDEALLAQGRASAQGVAAFKELGLPRMSGLGALLETPGARMLDVGTGVAALATAWAEAFPALTVVGLDVLPRVLDLASRTVAASSAAHRVVLREQDVSTLDEDDTYALVWLPAPFLPEGAMRAGVVATARSLVPGGWVMVGHGKFGGNGINDAVARFKTVAFGGTALDDQQAQDLLREAGLTDVFTAPTPQGAPAITCGRKAPV